MSNASVRSAIVEPMAKPSRSLVEHTEDVVTAFIALFGSSQSASDFTRRWLAFFRLGLDSAQSFLCNALLACRVHDWGKANSGFAAMLAKSGAQTVRHEVVSVLIIMQPDLWRWLESSKCVDLPLVLAAVAGHHLKAAEPAAWDDPRQFGAVQPNSFDADFSLTWNHPKIQEQLTILAKAFGIEGPLPGRLAEHWSVKTPRPNAIHYRTERRRACERLEQFYQDIEDNPSSDRARMLRAVRCALIAADSAGSALFRTHEESQRADKVHDHIRKWIGSAFNPAESLTADRIDSAVITPRIEELTSQGRSFSWNEFQEACADPTRVPARALLIAPCGSGKTLAAWRWVAARCHRRPVARAIFLYPTRGTATEGFRDYVARAGPTMAALVHGAAELDLDHLQPDDDLEARIAEARLFSLRQWPKRIFSATVDQFLAFLQHDYGSTCLLPLLADSVLVLDEVHSYDRGMFTALIQFLEHFDIPVLAMTATMLERRKNDLAKHLDVIDGLGFSHSASSLRNIADHPRYEVSTVPGVAEATKEALSALRSGLRVLWVVNTVDRAQQLAHGLSVGPRTESLRTSAGAPLLCYHSRFKLRDRRDRHESIVAAFKRGEGQERVAVLGITTQVCELSLDLDCDLLITEYAPISALIQRFGRCCRDQEAHDQGRTGLVVLYRPDSLLPYDKDEMKDVEHFIGELLHEVVSQSGLEERLAAIDGTSFLRKDARFITDGPWASAGQDHFRDSEDRTRQAVLPADEEEYRLLLKSRAKWRAQELIVPIPKDASDRSNRPAWMPSWLTFADVKRHEYLETLGYIPKAGGGFQIA